MPLNIKFLPPKEETKQSTDEQDKREADQRGRRVGQSSSRNPHLPEDPGSETKTRNPSMVELEKFL